MNTGAFISAGEACLIDPGLYPDEIEDIARLVRERGARPTLIVLTHSHWDHILGPEHFPGVKLVAQAQYIDFTREHGVDLVKPLAAWEKHVGLERARPFAIPQPDETFTETTMLRVGDAVLRLDHVPGHAADQLAVRHEATGAVWVSDILSDIEIPYISDNLAAYERTLERVASWEIKALVPGHGGGTTDAGEIKKRIEQDRKYLADVRAGAERALGEGRSIEGAVEMCAGIEVRNPDINAESHLLNVESAYMELGGKGDRREKGWAKGE